MVHVLRLFLFLVLLAPCFADDGWDMDRQPGDNYGTVNSNRVICVYAMSTQYSFLNRLLCYLIMAFAVGVGPFCPMIGFRLQVYVLIYSSTAAVHAIVLAGVTMNGVLDMDVLGTWAILSISCFMVLATFTMSSEIRESKFKPVFGYWGILVSVGVIYTFVSISHNYPDEPECRSSFSNELMTNTTDLLDPKFDCSYECFTAHQFLRASSDITIIPQAQFLKHLFHIAMVLLLALIFGLICGYFHYYAGIGSFVEVLRWVTITVVIARVIVLNEWYLVGFPEKEKLSAIGQWGPWFGVIPVLLVGLPIVLDDGWWLISHPHQM